MTRTTRPPVALTVSSRKIADDNARRHFQNAVAVAVLRSTNKRRPRNHAQAPNNTSRVHTVGGQEVQVRESLERRIEEAHARLTMTPPDTEARALANRALNRLEQHWAEIQEQINALDTSRGHPGGIPDTFLVTVPQLEVRVIGEEDETVSLIRHLWVGHVRLDLGTPGLKKFQHLDPDLLKGDWPLYAVRGDKTGLKPAKGSELWHRELLSALCPGPGLAFDVVSADLAPTSP
jgi:hypothetical protein